MLEIIIGGAIMSFLFGITVIFALLVFNPAYPWLTFVIIIGFFFLPFKRIISLFPGTKPMGRINRPRRKTEKPNE